PRFEGVTVEQGQLCPYLGLKHNRAIRFASPTPEHRCYIAGDPQEIPVDQSSYCLSSNHVHCPLYTGELIPSTAVALPVPARGLRGWVKGLSPRDRAIYAALLGMLVVILVIYAIGAYLFLSGPNGGEVANLTPSLTPTSAPTTSPTKLSTSIPTATAIVLPSITATPAPTSSALPSPSPAATSSATALPTSAPSDTPAP